MRIAKAPLRVSLFGGGTDLPEYCDLFTSTIVSFAINRHIYVTWNPRPTGGCRLTYSKVEELGSLTTSQHSLVRAAAQRYSIPEPCTLSIVSDVPKGTGLGSSSALAVCLVKMFHGGSLIGPELALEAYRLERTVSGAGVQDHLPPSCGGLNVYLIKDTETLAEVRQTPPSLRLIIRAYGMLLYTDRTREAGKILRVWSRSTEQLHGIRGLAEEIISELPYMTANTLGGYLDAGWQMKRTIGGVVDEALDGQYETAVERGALGGKLLGAGGGGCWFFLIPPHKRDRVKKALGLVEIPFGVTSGVAVEAEV